MFSGISSVSARVADGAGDYGSRVFVTESVDGVGDRGSGNATAVDV